MPGTPWGWWEQHSPISPRGVCSPVRGADVKCRDFQLAVQAPVNAVQGRRVAAGSQECSHTPHQAREQWESCGQQSLIRVPVKAPSSLTPRLSPKSWGWPLLGSTSVPQGTAPPTDALAGQRWGGGDTPSHPLQGVLTGPHPPPLPTAQTVLWAGPQPETNPAQPCWPVKTHSLGKNVGKPTANTRQHSKSRYEMVSK